MNIVTAANNKYVVHLFVMLKSLLCNLSQTNNVNIFILQSDIAITERKKIQELAILFQSNVQFIEVDDETIMSLIMNPYSSHISRETYYRILIPDLVPEYVEKALYLDCDMVVMEDLWKVWDTNVTEHYLAAVVDFMGVWEGENMVTPKGYSYFNAGFLLINVKKWRVEGISDLLKSTLVENSGKFKYMDQDALNVVFYRKYLQLELKWNYQTHFWRHKILTQPAVIHFTGPEKPWNASTEYNEMYLHYLNKN